MKKIVLLSSICAMGAVFAADPIEGLNDSSNVIGALANPTVTTTDGKVQKILVALPFLGYGAGNVNSNKVCDLIATVNLPEDTILRVVTQSDGRKVMEWNGWQLVKEPKTGIKKWQNIEAIEIDGKVDGISVSTPLAKNPEDVEVGRGSSFWLELPATDKPANFYTLGQVDFSLAKSMALEPNKWNLVGNPGEVGDYNVLANLTPGDGGYAFNDQITVQSTFGSTISEISYVYNVKPLQTSGCFLRGRTEITANSNPILLKPGQGCWIKLKNGGTLNF